jgi:hypothetical protein
LASSPTCTRAWRRATSRGFPCIGYCSHTVIVSVSTLNRRCCALAPTPKLTAVTGTTVSFPLTVTVAVPVLLSLSHCRCHCRCLCRCHCHGRCPCLTVAVAVPVSLSLSLSLSHCRCHTVVITHTDILHAQCGVANCAGDEHKIVWRGRRGRTNAKPSCRGVCGCSDVLQIGACCALLGPALPAPSCRTRLPYHVTRSRRAWREC